MDNIKGFALRFDKELCTQCGICEGSCAYGAIRLVDYPEIDVDACRLCGDCTRSCPAGALTMASAQTGNVDEGNGIYVLAETSRGKLSPVTAELLGKAAELAAQSGQCVEAILAGHGLEEQAKELIAYGAERVHLLDSEALSAYIEENYAKAVAKIVKELCPAVLLVGATQKGRGLSARLASILRTGLTADCTGLCIDPETGLLRQVRPAFGGNLMATIVTPGHRPQMASVRPGVMKAQRCDWSRTGEMVWHDLSAFEPDTRISLLGETVKVSTGKSLNDSRIVVGIGRGVRDKETVVEISRWAESIGAAVAGSRAAVECGLIDPSRQVGQTGQTISPDLYVAIGISGQIQHTAAITGAKRIIAINPDKDAPIFGMADYGWVSTVEDALPVLSEIGLKV